MRNQNPPQPQGIWRDDALVVEAERLTPPHQAEYIIDMGKDIGDVFELDGTVTKSVTKAFVRRNVDGTFVSAYPISETFQFKL
jgi:hypothetical protein